MRMFCMGCKCSDSKCINDILQVGYIAEVYICNNCGGKIEVVYDGKISSKHIKEYRFRKGEETQ